jgi:hypothetical protein
MLARVFPYLAIVINLVVFINIVLSTKLPYDLVVNGWLLILLIMGLGLRYFKRSWPISKYLLWTGTLCPLLLNGGLVINYYMSWYTYIEQYNIIEYTTNELILEQQMYQDYPQFRSYDRRYDIPPDFVVADHPPHAVQYTFRKGCLGLDVCVQRELFYLN